MGEPEAKHDDPYFETTWPDGEKHKPALVAGYNDHVGLYQDTNYLLGLTGVPGERGFVQHITVDAPLVFEALHLSIDLSAIQNQLNNHEARITALETVRDTHTLNIGSNLAAINAEITARAAADTTLTNADTALSARITTIETRIPTPLANFANDAAAATGGIAVGRFYRNGSVVMVRVT